MEVITMWAKVTNKGVFLQKPDFVPPDDSPEWMEYEDVPMPEYDVATQIMDGPWFTVVDGVLTKRWDVRDKTQEELDAELEGAKSRKVARLQRVHDGLVDAGLVTDVLVEGVPFHAKIDADSVSMWQLAKGACAGGDPFPICRDWHDVEHEDVPAAAVIAIADAVVAYRTSLWVNMAKKQKQTKAAGTVEAVQLIEW